MAPFFPVYVRRSDGKAAVTKPPSVRETNEPLPEQLDMTPNAQGICDYYRECQPGETKEIDWRRKLAGMLIREVAGAEHKDKNFILVALPENYRLYEHVRCKVSEVDGNTQKPTKSHAAGGNERQDAYLYGYPQGRKKRYRSPAEFFPHLLWLSTDEQGDPNNCSCKFCSPEELESDEKLKLPVKEAKPQVVKQEPRLSTPASAPVDGQMQPSKQPPQATLPCPLPRFRRNEQRLDGQFNQFLYRPGELIWFQRSQAWGLGIVRERDISPNYPPNNTERYQYRVQPLSHPLAHPQTLVCSQTQIRAWLCWSPPGYLCFGLNPSPSNNHRVHTYDTIDWQAYLNGHYGPGDAEVDGSILAAKSIETTYTLFDLVDSKASTKESGQTSELYYNGIFLGAEKIWLGEPLRIRNSANVNDMMVLHSIIDRQNPADPSRSQLTFVGDVYSQRIAQFEPNAMPKSNEHLPPRVRGELEARNAIASRAPDGSRRFTFFWKLEVKSARFSISDIKGRWYESSVLMPVLARSEYEDGLKKGELGDAGMWMNGHGECNKAPNAAHGAFKPADLRLKKREEAFARAVPATFRISKGLDDPKAAESSSTQANMKVKTARSAHTPQAETQQPQSHPPPDQTSQRQRQLQQSSHQQMPESEQEPQLQHQQAPQVVQRPPNHAQYHYDPRAPHRDQDQIMHDQQRHTATDLDFDQYMDFADGDAGDDAMQQDQNRNQNPYAAYGSGGGEPQYDDRSFEANFFGDGGAGH